MKQTRATIPTSGQQILARFTRVYPFRRICGSMTGMRLIESLVGTSTGRVWSRVPGGEVATSLDDHVGRAAFYIGDLDRKISWVCSQIVRPGDTVLDIGANIGIVTLLLSKLTGVNGKVHAFEPNPELQQILIETIEHNRVSNVCLHAIALGAERGYLELRIPAGNAGGASLVRNQELSNCKVVKVPVRPLSEILIEEDIKSIRLIKIDVEGFENDVLMGGAQVLKTVRPEAILFELNHYCGTIKNQPVIQTLRDFGYEFFSIPKRCLFRMHLNRFNPDENNNFNNSVSNDFLASPVGESYEKIAKLVRASE